MIFSFFQTRRVGVCEYRVFWWDGVLGHHSWVCGVHDGVHTHPRAPAAAVSPDEGVCTAFSTEDRARRDDERDGRREES